MDPDWLKPPKDTAELRKFNREFTRAQIREAERAVAQCEKDVERYNLDPHNTGIATTRRSITHRLASAQAELRAAWELLEQP